MKNRSEKQQDLDNLKSDLAKVSTVILSTFQGITVENDNKLRRAVQQAGGQYRVVKNTLAERAARAPRTRLCCKNLTGTNSIAYTETDPVSLAKALTKIAKDVPAFQFRAGIVEGRVLSIAEIQQLAALPSKEELISKVMFLLSSPAQRIASVAFGSEPQPGRHGQRSGQGQQVRVGGPATGSQQARSNPDLSNRGEDTAMANKVEAILEEIKGLTLLEAADLVKKMEETFGVSAAAAAPVMMAGGAAAGGAAAGGREDGVLGRAHRRGQRTRSTSSRPCVKSPAWA